ncbi:ABC transporter substrate-binding protein [Thermoanaerobacterium sp. DL9XJH110]|uniref:ABC transporter substrate-binding protein n=1 Tax=Thermoanaerobacterium sp. DL9XJH110 TaxID=3386643 RepID=UPI003BB5206C
MWYKKFISLTVAFVLIMTLLTGCGGSGDTSKSSDQSGENEVVNLKHWVWLDNPNDPTFAQLVKEFNDTHPNIHVDVEVIGWNDFHTKLLGSVTGGSAPDTSSFKLTWQPEFIEQDALLPLDDYLKDWPGKSDVVDNLWDVMQYKDGKHYVMPWELQVLYMYYRPSMFEKAGVKVPQTWDEFLEVARKLTVDTNGDGKIDQYGFGMRGARGGHEPWASFIMAYVPGNQFFDDKGNSTLTTPSAIKANEFFLDLYRKYKVVPPTAPMDGFNEIIANFKAGKTAMVVHHIKSSNDMIKQFGDDVDAFPVPAGPYGRWTSLGDTENVIFKSTKHPKEAFTFISWLSEKEQLERWDKATGNVPVLKSLQQLDEFKNNRFMKASFDSMQYAHTYPINENMGEWIESLWPATTQQALEGKITGKEMMKKLAEGMTK